MIATSNTAPLAPAPGVTLDMIIDMVCDRMDRSRADVVSGDDRSAQTLRARHVVMWLARRLLQMPHAEIGAALGGRDARSATDGEARITALRADRAAREELNALDLEIRAAGRVVDRTGLPLRKPLCAIEIARRVVGGGRAATQVSIAEIAALAAHVIAAASERSQEVAHV